MQPTITIADFMFFTMKVLLKVHTFVKPTKDLTLLSATIYLTVTIVSTNHQSF